MRRLALRLCYAALFCVALATTSVGLLGVLAFTPPGFYSTQVAAAAGNGQAQAAGHHLERLRREFLTWEAQSIARQQTDPAYDPAQDVHTFRVSEQQLNALLTADAKSLGGGAVTDPRVHFDDGRVEVAASLATPAGGLVCSFAFTPAQTAQGDHALQASGARIGVLPLPLGLIAGWLPKESNRLQGDLYFDNTGAMPALTLTLRRGGQPGPTTKSIAFEQGELVVELTAPTAPPK